jgi:hypothetical protein
MGLHFKKLYTLKVHFIKANWHCSLLDDGLSSDKYSFRIKVSTFSY